MLLKLKEQANTRRFTGGEVDSASRNLARYIDTIADRYIPNLDTMLVYRLDRFGRGGHHRPFNDAGFAAVRIMETNEHYDRQHQDLRTEDGVEYGDTIEGVDFDYTAKLTSLNAVTMASMAWAPAPPKEVKITGAVTANTSFSWANKCMTRTLLAIKFIGVTRASRNGSLVNTWVMFQNIHLKMW